MTTQPEAPIGTTGTNLLGLPATSRADVSTALALKTDITDGVMTNPTITGGAVSATVLSSGMVTATGSTTPRALADRFPRLDPKDFGAACDAQQYGFTATLSGTALAVTVAKFALTDVGSTICIAGAGTGGAMHVTTIAGFTNSTHVTLTAAAPTALAAVVGTEITWGAHDDTTFIQLALDRAATVGGTVVLSGISLISAPLEMRPLVAQGSTPASTGVHFMNSPGIHLTSDSGGTLVAIAVMAYMVHPIYNAGISGGVAPFYAEVTKLTLNGCDLAVIGISSEYCMHNTYRHNRIFNVATGIEVQGYGGELIEENVIRAATCIKYGTAAIPGGGDSKIDRNDFYPTNGAGTCMAVDVGPYGGDATITANTISRVQSTGTGLCYGVRLSGDEAPDAAHETRHVIIENNEFWSTDVGIYGRSFAGATRNVWSNKITGNHAYATYGVLADLDNCDDFFISENFCNGVHLSVAAGPAITLTSCSRMRVNDNNAGNYTAGFLVGVDLLDCEIVDNTVYNVGRSGAGATIISLASVTSCLRNVVRNNHFTQTSGAFAQNGVVETAGVDYTIAVDNFFSGVTTQYTAVGANSQMGTVVITGGTIAGITALAASGVCVFGGTAQAVGQNIFIATTAGFARSLVYSSAGGNRWAVQANAAAEAGANVGSDLVVQRYTDAAAFIDNALTITRSTGIVTAPNGLRVLSTSGPTWTAGTGAPATTQPKGSMWSRTDGGVGTTLYVSQGAGVWNAVAGV